MDERQAVIFRELGEALRNSMIIDSDASGDFLDLLEQLKAAEAEGGEPSRDTSSTQ